MSGWFLFSGGDRRRLRQERLLRVDLVRWWVPGAWGGARDEWCPWRRHLFYYLHYSPPGVPEERAFSRDQVADRVCLGRAWVLTFAKRFGRSGVCRRADRLVSRRKAAATFILLLALFAAAVPQLPALSGL